MKIGRIILGILFVLSLSACQDAGTNPLNADEPPITDNPIDTPTDPDDSAPDDPTPTDPNPERPSPEPTPTKGQNRWSDASTWGGSVPAEGKTVTIPEGKTVVLDTSTPKLGGLVINGTLVFEDKDLELQSAWIVVKGKLEIGTAEKPFQSKATITLTGGSSLTGEGTKFINVAGGATLSLHGKERRAWTRLDKTLTAGERSFTLKDATDWQAGDKLVIASTDFDLGQAESFEVSSVQGKTVTVTKAAEYMHWGQLMSYQGKTLDQRAEVILLSRNILIQGDAGSETNGRGGHLLMAKNAKAFIDSVEFYRMGQSGEMGRYPIHFHLMGDSSRGLYVKNSSIHHTFNRCLTIHGSHGVNVINNVTFNSKGHCFFLEDGIEVDNVFQSNVGVNACKPDDDKALLPSDNDYRGPAVYWITNPDNTFENNVAAGSEGTGFWIALPENPTGLSKTDKVWPRFTPLKSFVANSSHSNKSDGLHVDRGPFANVQDGLDTSTYYAPKANPDAVEIRRGNPKNDSASVTAVFKDFTAYKNRGNGVWLRGEHHLLDGAKLADNSVGVTFASRETVATNSLFVGETNNKGTPDERELRKGWVGVDGRTLPMPWQPDFAIRGFEFYDGKIGVKNSHFAGFKSDSLRKAAALSYLDFTDFRVDPLNFATNLSFAEGTNRVYLAKRNLPSDNDKGEDGYRSASFIDTDGSVTGKAGASVVVNNDFMLGNKCTFKQAWGAYVCQHDYLALWLENEDSGPKDIGPVTLKRSNGKSHTLLGTPRGGANIYFRSSLMKGDSYNIDLNGATPSHLRIRLDALGQDSFRMSLDYSASNVHVYRNYWIDERNQVESVNSLAALNNHPGDAYFLANGKLHMKFKAKDDKDWTSLEICKTKLCK